MVAIRSVVCPVDFSAATSRQVDLAVNVCRAFGARLVLHHNVTDVSVGSGVGWMWHADHEPPPPASVDDRIRSLLSRMPREIAVETCITRGAITEGVLAVSDAAEADLVVLCEHAGKAENHASVIEFMIEHSSHAVLALHDPGEDAMVPAFGSVEDEDVMTQNVLVPTNLTDESHPQVDFACELARMFPLRLQLLHAADAGVTHAAHDRLDELVPADLRTRTATHVATGDPVTTIVSFARTLSAAFIVMGEHTRVPVKRWLKRDTSRAVLHKAHCPVWYVPAALAPAMSFERFAHSDEKSRVWGNV